jgi:hypothetical protein
MGEVTVRRVVGSRIYGRYGYCISCNWVYLYYREQFVLLRLRNLGVDVLKLSSFCTEARWCANFEGYKSHVFPSIAW